MRLSAPGKVLSPVPLYVTVVAYTQVWMFPSYRLRSRQTQKQATSSTTQQRYEETVAMFEGKFKISNKWELEGKSEQAYALLHEAVAKNPKLTLQLTGPRAYRLTVAHLLLVACCCVVGHGRLS